MSNDNPSSGEPHVSLENDLQAMAEVYQHDDLPPPALDQQIMAAARRHSSRSRARFKWIPAMATAAVVMLSVSVYWQSPHDPSSDALISESMPQLQSINRDLGGAYSSAETSATDSDDSSFEADAIEGGASFAQERAPTAVQAPHFTDADSGVSKARVPPRDSAGAMMAEPLASEARVATEPVPNPDSESEDTIEALNVTATSSPARNLKQVQRNTTLDTNTQPQQLATKTYETKAHETNEGILFARHPECAELQLPASSREVPSMIANQLLIQVDSEAQEYELRCADGAWHVQPPFPNDAGDHVERESKSDAELNDPVSRGKPNP